RRARSDVARAPDRRRRRRRPRVGARAGPRRRPGPAGRRRRAVRGDRRAARRSGAPGRAGDARARTRDDALPAAAPRCGDDRRVGAARRRCRVKVLWLHNHYRVHGGESAAADREAHLLAATPGVTVVQEAAHRGATAAGGATARCLLRWRTAWWVAGSRGVRALCRAHRPDVVHAHNVWPLLSPSVFAAARAERVPAVFTAHNYYLFC